MNARRVLGYSLACQLTSTQCFAPSRYCMGDLPLLGDFTRVLALNTFACHELAFIKDPFSRALARTEGSIRVLQVQYRDTPDRTIESTLGAVLEHAPDLEELCARLCGKTPSGFFEQILQIKPGRTTPYYSSLRTIRLDDLVVKDLLDTDHGLPLELSPLRALGALTAIHLYSMLDCQAQCISTYVRKLTWTRKVGEEFAFDSAWIRAQRYGDLNGVPEHVSELLKSAPNLTLEAPLRYRSRARFFRAADVVFAAQSDDPHR